MSLQIQARPTTYKGIVMRSRLEAQFAAQLDLTESEWLYEPRAYANELGQYLPDFEIVAYRGRPMPQPTFFEVRPTVERAMLAMNRMPIIWDSEPTALLHIIVPGVLVYSASSIDRVWALE